MELPQMFLLMLVVSPWVILATRRRVSFTSCLSTKTDRDILESKPVRSRIECSVKCLNKPVCLSASYCKTGDGYTCQLTGSYVEGNCSMLAAGDGCGQTAMVDPCENGGTFYPYNRTCHCVKGFVGHYCQRRYRDCTETPNPSWFSQYVIQPFGSKDALEWVCAQGKGRLAEIYSATFNANYTLPWQQMKWSYRYFEGFSFYGLENLHQVTKQGVYDIDIKLFTKTEKGRILYRNFRVDSEAEGYALHWDSVHWYKTQNKSALFLDGLGGAGDETKNLNGARFGTYDNDVNGCARANNARWWFNPLGCTKLRFHAKGLYWPTIRNGTVIVEFVDFVVMFVKKVYWYVEDDLVL